VSADELESSVGHTFLDKRVGGEVLEGRVHGLLQKSKNIFSSVKQCKTESVLASC
jgi:hypothetical protein